MRGELRTEEKGEERGEVRILRICIWFWTIKSRWRQRITSEDSIRREESFFFLFFLLTPWIYL